MFSSPTLKLVGVVVAATAVLANSASALDIQGTYKGTHENEVELTIKQAPRDKLGNRSRYEVQVSALGAPNAGGSRCGGAMTAVGTFNEETKRLIAVSVGDMPKPEPKDVCALVISFKKAMIDVEESEGCFFFRGAMCSFAGKLKRLSR